MTPEENKNINTANNEINKAIESIRNKHAGANINEARKLLSVAGKALINNNLNDAIEFAKKSQLAAKPHTEYLLSRAREQAARAEKYFSSKEYANAISKWDAAQKEYERAAGVASERGEIEIIDRIKEVKEKINTNISRAEISIDNKEMLNLVNAGNGFVNEANQLFNNKEFDNSIQVYEKARDEFKNALNYAEKRDFKDDKQKLGTALKSINESITASFLSKGEFMLKSAEEIYKKNSYMESEEKFTSAVKFLEELNINEKDVNEMLSAGREGIILAKIGQGEEKMRTADELTKQSKYYDAKEGYKTARNYFENLIEEVSKYGFSNLVEDINNRIQTCTQNISTTTAVLTDVGGVVNLEIIPVDAVIKGAGIFNREEGYKKHKLPHDPTEKLKKDYAVIGKIGGGGFADVYKATRKKEGDIVAVKVPRNMNRPAEDVFFREVRTWEKLNHRNIVKLINPRLNPMPHLVLEYVDGGSLEEYLKKQEIDIQTACKICFDIASGIEYAHNKYVIHGDINPRNIMISKTGDAKITDFGLAKIASASASARGYTPPYASKEQVVEGKVYEKTDIYQIGLTFYFMLTGKNPYDAGSIPETEKRVKQHNPTFPSKYNKKADEFDDIIMRCLLKDYKERPTLREFRECIYKFMKCKYNESLHLTKNYSKLIEVNCELAILAAKCEHKKECYTALNCAIEKVRSPNTREELKRVIKEVEYRISENMTMEPMVDKMDIFLKKVKSE